MPLNLNTDIPLSARTASIGNPFLEAFSGALQLRQQQEAGRALADQRRASAEEQRLKIAEAKREQFEQEALTGLFSSGQPVKPQQVYSIVGPKRGADILKGISALQEQDVKTEDALRAHVGTILGGIDALPANMRPQAYGMARNDFVTKGYVSPDQVPEQYTPEYVAAARKWALTPKEQFEQEAAAARDKIAATKAAAELPGIQADAAVKQQVAAGTQGGLTPEQQRTAKTAADQLAVSRGNLSVAQARETREAQSDPMLAAMGGGGPQAAAALGSLPEGVQSQVKALIEGRMAFPGGAAMRSPYWQKMLTLVSAADPTFDAVNFNSRAATRRDFTSGGSAKTVNAIQTVIGHLSDLSDKAEALHNGSIPALNSVKNYFSSAAGGAAVPSFETIKKGVTDELTRVWRQAGGSEQDIKTWSENLNSSQSPDQFKGVLATVGDMLESKLGALDTQYQQGMGTDKVSAISPTSRAHLNKLKGTSEPAATQLVEMTAPDGRRLHVPVGDVDRLTKLGAKKVGG